MDNNTDTAVIQAPSATGAFFRALAIAGAIYLVYSLGMLFFNRANISLPSFGWAAVAIISTLAYLLMIGVVIRLLSRPGLTARQEVCYMLLSLLLFLALNPVVWQLVSQLMNGAALSTLWESLESPLPDSLPLIILGTITPLLLILTGVFSGRLLARMIKEISILVPVAIVAAMIDFWGVYWGVVATMSENAPVAVSSIGSASTVAASVPEETMVQATGAMRFLVQLAPPDSIGIGDFLFFAFFLACAFRLGFSAARTMWGLVVGLLLACTVMALDGQRIFGHDLVIAYLPGLVFISGGILVANIGSWKLTKKEWLMTLLLVVILAVPISMSITRSVLDKPRDSSASYQLPIKSAQSLGFRLQQKILKESPQQPKQVKILAEVYLFAIDGENITVQQYQMLALALSKKVSLRNSWQYTFHGKVQKAKDGKVNWLIGEQGSAPPTTVLQRLKAPEGKEITTLSNAPSLPRNADKLLDNIAELRPLLAPDARAFLLYFYPKEAELRDEKGELVKKLPY